MDSCIGQTLSDYRHRDGFAAAINSDATAARSAQGNSRGNHLDVKGIGPMGGILRAIDPGAMPRAAAGTDELKFDPCEMEHFSHFPPVDSAGDMVGMVDAKRRFGKDIDRAPMADVDFGKFFCDQGNLAFKVFGGPAVAVDDFAL